MCLRRNLTAALFALAFFAIATPAHAGKLRLSALGGLGAGITDVDTMDSKTGFGGIFRLGVSAQVAPTIYGGVYYSHARSHVDEVSVGNNTGIDTISFAIHPSGIGAMFTLDLPTIAVDLYAGYTFGSYVASIDFDGFGVNGSTDMSGFQAGAFAGYDMTVAPQFSVQIGPSFQFASVSIDANSDTNQPEADATHMLIALAVQGTFETFF